MNTTIGTCDAAKILGTCPRTVATYFDRGLLIGYRQDWSRNRRISIESLRSFMLERGIATDRLDAIHPPIAVGALVR